MFYIFLVSVVVCVCFAFEWTGGRVCGGRLGLWGLGRRLGMSVVSIKYVLVEGGGGVVSSVHFYCQTSHVRGSVKNCM